MHLPGVYGLTELGPCRPRDPSVRSEPAKARRAYNGHPPGKPSVSTVLAGAVNP